MLFTDGSDFLQNALQKMRDIIQSIHPVSEEEWLCFSSLWTPFSAERKQVISREEEKEKYLYFVIEGVQRIYYYDEQGKEATILFTYPPSFGGILDSLLLQQLSKFRYEAVTSSAFLRAPLQELQHTMERYPAINHIIRLGVTAALSGVLERLVELQCFSAEERYKKLLKRSPHILNLVPQKYLANYLGMDPTNFSKLVNKVRI
jgi:CRP-like cAMP-binding protein